MRLISSIRSGGLEGLLALSSAVRLRAPRSRDPTSSESSVPPDPWQGGTRGLDKPRPHLPALLRLLHPNLSVSASPSCSPAQPRNQLAVSILTGVNSPQPPGVGGGGCSVAGASFCSVNSASSRSKRRRPEFPIVGSPALGHPSHPPGPCAYLGFSPPLVGCERPQRATRSRRLRSLTSDSPVGLYSLGVYLFEVLGDVHCCCYENYPCELQEKKRKRNLSPEND